MKLQKPKIIEHMVNDESQFEHWSLGENKFGRTQERGRKRKWNGLGDWPRVVSARVLCFLLPALNARLGKPYIHVVRVSGNWPGGLFAPTDGVRSSHTANVLGAQITTPW